jgi:hypothetical protein
VTTIESLVALPWQSPMFSLDAKTTRQSSAHARETVKEFTCSGARARAAMNKLKRHAKSALDDVPTQDVEPFSGVSIDCKQD